MTKTTLAFAALIAGTTLASTANADGVRVGFGFPLGSFVAHSNEAFSGRDVRQVDRSRYVRREYDADAARKIAKVKQASRHEVAEAPANKPVNVQTAKLEDKLASDPATTTVIAKTPIATGDTTAPANEPKKTVNADNNAASDTPVATKTDPASAAVAEVKHVCRRYSPAIAALVDVPCE